MRREQVAVRSSRGRRPESQPSPSAGSTAASTNYRGGLGAPLAVVTLANPMTAAVIGLTLLGERLQGGAAGVLLALAGAGLASWGVVLLSRATPGPAVHDEHPVAAVLALEPGSASAEPALLPRPTTEPGHLTPL